jgi:hypothetical protein
MILTKNQALSLMQTMSNEILYCMYFLYCLPIYILIFIRLYLSEHGLGLSLRYPLANNVGYFLSIPL